MSNITEKYASHLGPTTLTEVGYEIIMAGVVQGSRVSAAAVHLGGGWYEVTYVRDDNTACVLKVTSTDDATALDFKALNPRVVSGVTNDVGITQAGADKVWNATTRTLTSFGTLVTSIWAHLTALAIKAKTDLIGTGRVNTEGRAPVGGHYSIVQGDDYLAADGRALSWNSDSWPDLTGATVIMRLATVINEDGDLLELDGVVSQAGEATQIVEVDVESATSEALAPHTSIDFDVEATLANEHSVTLVQAKLTIKPDVR